MAYNGFPDAGNCVGGMMNESNDRVKVWMPGLGKTLRCIDVGA